MGTVISNTLYMFFIAVIISFFVAFIIKMIFVAIGLLSKRRISDMDNTITSMEAVQREAKRQDNAEAVYAAISLALHLYQKEIHDFENTVITIKKAVRPYSPWSSKIYGIRQMPR